MRLLRRLRLLRPVKLLRPVRLLRRRCPRAAAVRAAAVRTAAVRARQSAPRQSAPRQSAPRQSAPRQSAQPRQLGADLAGEVQRWLIRSGARSVRREFGEQVRRTLGGGREEPTDVWGAATTEPPPDESLDSPECAWCPICRGARRIRESGPGLGSQLRPVPATRWPRPSRRHWPPSTRCCRLARVPLPGSGGPRARTPQARRGRSRESGGPAAGPAGGRLAAGSPAAH